jgi:hypothetical protein
MSFKRAAIFRNIGAGVLCILGIVACERDLEDIAVDLAGQRPFGVGDSIIEVIAYNVNVDSNRTDNNNINKLPLALFGVNRDNDFGQLRSKFVSQVTLPFNRVSFGDNPVIDEVVIDIPYFSRLEGQQDAIDPVTGEPITDESGDTLQVPNFSLDSIFGNRDAAFETRIFELGTFLNTLDPDDPAQQKKYYSNRDFEIKDLLYQGTFKTDANDTVLYVERRYLDGDISTVDDVDTIKQDPVVPSIKFRLDKEFFQRRFLDHDNPADFDNNDDFVRYFRGLYFDALGIDGALMNLTLNSATMTIYYSNDQIVIEGADEDLNYNGITGESGVVAKTKRQLSFPFGAVASGIYERDYGGTALQNYLLNPDKINGEPSLFVQGASGTEAVIELFNEENLKQMKEKDWLINEANLIFYLDGDQSEIPNSLFLYKKDYNSFVDDYYDRRFGPEVFGGQLEYDSDGNPERYYFRITDYVTQVLKTSDPIALSKLALKNYVRTDVPDFTRLDTLVSDWNYIPKGVILHGNRPANNEKRIVLEIFYSNNP